MSRIEGLLSEVIMEMDATNTQRIEAFMDITEDCSWIISIKLADNNAPDAQSDVRLINLNYLENTARRSVRK